MTDVRKGLLACGILAVLVYIAVVVVADVVTPGHDPVVNSVSELIGTGAVNRDLYTPFFALSALLFIAYGVGAVLSFRERRSRLLTIGGALIVVYGISAVLIALAFPIDPIGEPLTFQGSMHLALVAITAPIIMATILLIGYGLYRDGRRLFGVYSAVTFVVVVGFGASSLYLLANGIPLLGLVERVTQYAYMLWYLVLAVVLIRDR